MNAADCLHCCWTACQFLCGSEEPTRTPVPTEDPNTQAASVTDQPAGSINAKSLGRCGAEAKAASQALKNALELANEDNWDSAQCHAVGYAGEKLTALVEKLPQLGGRGEALKEQIEDICSTGCGNGMYSVNDYFKAGLQGKDPARNSASSLKAASHTDFADQLSALRDLCKQAKRFS